MAASEVVVPLTPLLTISPDGTSETHPFAAEFHDEIDVPNATQCIPGRIISLYIITALHASSVLCMLLDVSTSSKLFLLNEYKFGASVISFDFIIMAILLGWSVAQVAIAYKLSSKNTLKATALCWVVLLAEAVFIVIFVFGLFGNMPSNSNPFRAAGGIILTTVICFQFAYTILVTSFLGARFKAYRCGPQQACCLPHGGYQSLV
jgi:hypothetical protein